MEESGIHASVNRTGIEINKVHMGICIGIHFSTCIRKVIKSKYITFCICKLSQESCTFAKWIPSCLCIIHRMQICKTLNLKYILKHQGDSEVEPKLTAHDVVKKK